MPDPAAHRSPGKRAKDPNFMLVVAISTVILLLLFVGAWLLVMHSGRHLLPAKQHDNEPHATLRVPGSAPAEG